MDVAECESCGKKVVLRNGRCVICKKQIIQKKGFFSSPMSGIEILTSLIGASFLVFILSEYNGDRKERIAAEKIAVQQEQVQQRKLAKQAAIRDANKRAADEQKAAYEKSQKILEKQQREEKRMAEKEACKRSIACQAEKFASHAEVYCPQYIEKFASYDFKWTDEGWFSRKFTRQGIVNGGAGIVRYSGDSIKMQNGFGAWSNMIYSCDINTKTEKIVDASVKKGRF